MLNYAFSQSTGRVATLPFYLYDMIHEHPDKALKIIKSELQLARNYNIIISLIFFYFIVPNISEFIECNLLMSSWLILLCVLNFISLSPKCIILTRVFELDNNYQIVSIADLNEAKNVLRFDIWEKLVVTKIYYLNQVLSNCILFTYIFGIFLFFLEWKEFGLFKACQNDVFLKRSCFFLIIGLIIKFILSNKNVFKIIHDNNNILNKKIIKTNLSIDEFEKLKKNDQNMCVICLLEYKCHDEVTFMDCKHLFHFECLQNWLKIKKKCPFCNKF